VGKNLASSTGFKIGFNNDSEAGASNGTPGDAKCITEILGKTKTRKLGDKIYLFVSRQNKPIKQSNKCVDVYV